MKRHIINIEDFNQYVPQELLVAASSGPVAKKLVLVTSFDEHSYPKTVFEVRVPSIDSVTICYNLDQAIDEYNKY